MKNNNKKARYYIVRKSRYIKYLNPSQKSGRIWIENTEFTHIPSKML